MDVEQDFRLPNAIEAAKHKLRFSNQTIGEFVWERLHHSKEEARKDVALVPPLFLPPQDHDAQVYAEITMFMSRSCLLGFGGEKYVDSEDDAYSFSDSSRANRQTIEIVTNERCGKPCVLDGEALAYCQLDPAPLEKLLFAVLVEASRVRAEHKEPMRPGKFAIDCSGYVRGSIEWIPAMLSSFSPPAPTDTFDATLRWARNTLWRNTEYRIESFPNFVGRSLNFRKRTVLCRKDIMAKFAYVASSLSVEQVLYMIDSISEEYFTIDREHGKKTADGRSVNECRIKAEDPSAEYESDGESVKTLV